jgi:hypothetical protein
LKVQAAPSDVWNELGVEIGKVRKGLAELVAQTLLVQAENVSRGIAAYPAKASYRKLSATKFCRLRTTTLEKAPETLYVWIDSGAQETFDHDQLSYL